MKNFVAKKLIFLLSFFLLPIFTAAAASVSEIKIELVYEGHKFVFIDKYIPADNPLIADELFQRKINGTYQQKKEIMNKCLATGSTFKNAVLYTMPMLEPVVEKAIFQINTKAVDSKIEFIPDCRPMFRISRDRPGKKVDEEQLYMDIYYGLCSRPSIKVEIEPDSIPPKVTIYDNINLTKLRTRYSTNYSYSNENRKHNIKLALKKVNGTVLEENQEFSFNKTVGRRSKANGFKEAKIIVGGKYENGVGGGVCQASTTVYNAALLAGLKITAVQNHSLECSYELPSFDAMVNATYSDLKFMNTEKTPVFIRAYGTDSSAVVEVYGSPMEYTIKRKSEIVYRKDPPPRKKVVDYDYKYHTPETPSGEVKVIKHSKGEMKSIGYLLYYDKKGMLVKRVKIREDKYLSTQGEEVIAP